MDAKNTPNPLLDYMKQFNIIEFQVLESMEDWVRVVQPNGEIIYANPAMRKASPKEPVGLFCEYENESDIPRCVSNVTFLTGRTMTKEERFDGRHYSVKSSPVFDHKDNILAAVEVFRDITAETNIRIDLFNANRKMTDDIRLARSIQNAILPEKGRHHHLICDFAYVPSDQLSGDFFDVVCMPGDRHGIYIADVMGHGVAASIMTMFIRQTMRSLLAEAKDTTPSAILRELNNRYTELTMDDKQYFTLFLGIIDDETGRITYVNAGHNSIPLLANGKQSVLLENSGLPISNLQLARSYTERTETLNNGDRLLFYTDGITETRDYKKRVYGEQRLYDLFSTHPVDTLQTIVDDVNAFRWGEQEDDIALLLIEYNPKG